MRAEGLEPPRSLEHQDLNLDCLPVPARPPTPGNPGGQRVLSTSMADTVLVHPNRDKAESKATRAIVMLLLHHQRRADLDRDDRRLVAAPGRPGSVVRLRAIYLGMAFFVSRWNRGVLPVGAALAILFSVIAAVAGPAWFDRDKAGFQDPTLDPSLLGLLTLILVPFSSVGRLRDAGVPAAVERRGRGVERRGRPLRRRRRRPRSNPAGLTRRPPAPLPSERPPGWRNWRYAMASKAIVPLRTCGFESHPGYCGPPRVTPYEHAFAHAGSAGS